MHLMEVLSELELPTSQRDPLRDVIDELTELGMAKEMPGNRFRLNSRRQRRSTKTSEAPVSEEVDLVGWLSVHPRGFGFVAVEDGGPDVFVPRAHFGTALHRDRVRVSVRPSPKGREGEVREVIRRGVGRIAGALHIVRKRMWLEPGDPRGPERVDVVGTLPLGVTDGDEVVAQIAKWPDFEGDAMQARVLSLLGQRGSAAVELEKMKIREGIEEELPEDAVIEAQAFGTEVRPEDIEGREDLRGYDLLTIDPPTARDHDDAIWAERLDGGGFRVIVAIADVSHYVRPESALDRAALDRCTSIYLPDRVIPMLPHELSSNLASLVPNEDRLTMAVEVDVGPRGAIRKHRFLEGVMRSRARLSYGGVARALGFTEEPEQQEEAESRLDLLQTLWDVSKVLRTKRRRRGSLDFDLPEPIVVLADDGEPLDVKRSRTDPGLRKTYGMIEDLMLLANEVVATDLSRRAIPAIYRIHGPPNEQKIAAFAALAESLGHPFSADSKSLATFLRKVEGTEHAQALSFLLLRAMQQASYATTNIGHFALAARYYLHFTSPIRRYPDLAVHRLVRAIIRKERLKKKELARTLEAQAAACSRLERRALLVDREATSVYRAILMRDRVGEEFEAQVTGVAEHGVYVAFDEPFVEARVPIDTLGNDWYELDKMGLRLVGSRSGHSYGLGDRVTVKLENVSVEGRELTCAMVGVSAEPRVPGRERRGPRRDDKKRGGRYADKKSAGGRGNKRGDYKSRKSHSESSRSGGTSARGKSPPKRRSRKKR